MTLLKSVLSISILVFLAACSSDSGQSSDPASSQTDDASAQQADDVNGSVDDELASSENTGTGTEDTDAGTGTDTGTGTGTGTEDTGTGTEGIRALALALALARKIQALSFLVILTVPTALTISMVAYYSLQCSPAELTQSAAAMPWCASRPPVPLRCRQW